MNQGDVYWYTFKEPDRRRPVVVLIVCAVDVRAGIEQQVEHLVPSGFDGDVERLRPAAPERVGSDRVDQIGRALEQRPRLVDSAGADEFQERGCKLICKHLGSG